MVAIASFILFGSKAYAQQPVVDTLPGQDTSVVTSTIVPAQDSIVPVQQAISHPQDSAIYYRLNKKFFVSIWDDAKYTVTRPLHWDKKDVTKFTVILGLTTALAASDYEIKQFFITHRANAYTSVVRQVEPFGNAYGPYLVGGMYLAGVIAKDRRLESAGLMAAKSLVISTAIYATIKSVVRRGRPSYFDSPFNFNAPGSNDKRFTSFPSGHSNTIMTVATAIAESYGKDHKWVPWVCYGIAGLTGISRLYDNRHWSSDVLIGMSLGHFVTKSVFRHHREQEKKRALQLKLM
ncbi:membrane-associated phospholipid phosphatase [Chitinophaga skermanii]|uniref:Membrane-associated phospholipid phosphatase n=2 Tax=Chitinophaga skermanii TaxID=331697 RepID=A0A327QL52_9BACT|nr:membrane-associated phospholipid phosphatase [Chitinophaga skermanii]